jgi:diketogulonate reductase-like aldo/keto reductase
MAQIALAWLHNRPAAVIPILGARRLAQLRDNLASFEFELSGEHLKSLDEASRIEPGFPQDLYAIKAVLHSDMAGCAKALLLNRKSDRGMQM